ncbi:MAG: glycosyltransferase [Planctomycetota bacterium]
MTRRVMLMASSLRGGGSERQTALLLGKLDRSKLTPHLYLIERAGDLLDEIPEDVIVHSFDEASVEGGFYFPGRRLHQQSKHVLNIIREHRIDMIYDRTFHMTMIAGPACRQSQTPRVSTIVSPPEFALPLVESRFINLKRRRLSRAYRQSHSVVAVSRTAAESAEKYYGLQRDSVHVSHNPVDVEATQQRATTMQLARDATCLNFVCVGRMTAEKGHLDLLDAISTLEENWSDSIPKIRLKLVGDGPLKESLQSHWHAISTGVHCVDFLGSQPNAAPYIQNADALILPSHFEGMPNVVLEAMALRIPVIATRSGGTVELEREQPTIAWAEPENSASLATAIQQFALEPESAAERVESAWQMIRQYHDVDIQTRRIEELLLSSVALDDAKTVR